MLVARGQLPARAFIYAHGAVHRQTQAASLNLLLSFGELGQAFSWHCQVAAAFNAMQKLRRREWNPGLPHARRN